MKLSDLKDAAIADRACGSFARVLADIREADAEEQREVELRAETINAELLAALKQAVAWMDGEATPINALVHARAIIAKAEAA